MPRSTSTICRKCVVPRGELEEKWNVQSTRDLETGAPIDELRAHDASLYGSRNDLSRLSKELDDTCNHLVQLPP